MLMSPINTSHRVYIWSFKSDFFYLLNLFRLVPFPSKAGLRCTVCNASPQSDKKACSKLLHKSRLILAPRKQTTTSPRHFKQLFWERREKRATKGRLMRKAAEWTKGISPLHTEEEEEARSANHSLLTVLKFQVRLKESLFLRLIVP